MTWSTGSACQRSVKSRPSAPGSPFTYLSNHAVVYQADMSIPRSVPGGTNTIAGL
jgi:hypothetical protein